VSTNPFTHGDLGNGYRILSFDEASDPVIDQHDLIHRVLPATGVGCIHGASIQKARLLALDIALTIGGASDWQGFRVTNGRTIYFGRDARSVSMRNQVAAFKREKGSSSYFTLGLTRAEGAPQIKDIPIRPRVVFFEAPKFEAENFYAAQDLAETFDCLVVIVSRDRHHWSDVCIKVEDRVAIIDNQERAQIPIETKAVTIGRNRFGEPVISEVIHEPRFDVEACVRRFEEMEADGTPARESSQADNWAGYVIAEVCDIDIDDLDKKRMVVGILNTWKAKGIVEVRSWRSEHRKWCNCIFAPAQNTYEF